MYEILSGALMMACFVAGLFFFKFWRKTKDHLFLIFSFSFWMLSFERLALGTLGASNQEYGPKIYLIRLVAFVLILIAIINKNRERN